MVREDDGLAERFEEFRPRLTAVAYRMLGSHAEADDAVQDAWIRFSRAGVEGVQNLGGWLTTIVARTCLNALRSRALRREDPLGVHLPDPIVRRAGRPGGAGRAEPPGPEDEALVADAVSLALVVVLDTLAPAERLAFVLHDLFDLPFAEIAPMVGRSPEAARQLASRARRRVRTAEGPPSAVDPAAQRRVVDAFFAATRNGDFEALVTLLDPDVVLRADGGELRREASARLRGASAVADRALLFNQPGAVLEPVLVNGAAGAVVSRAGAPVSVMGFTVAGGRITRIDILLDPARLARLDLP